MENELKQRVLNSIENLREKKFRIYFFVQDTKGNAKAYIRYIYQMAKVLKDNGFNPTILHEKNDYTGVSSWLGEEYMEISHQSLEEQNLQVAPEDLLVLPEIFGFVMDQVKNLPCGKIVLTQQYAYMLETLSPGQTWNQFGFMKCITTNHKVKEYIERIMRNVSYDIIEPYISDKFQPKNLPALPIVGVHTKDHSEAVNLIKAFYLKFPQYRWFTFRDLRGLSETEFANSLRECFVSVWIDNKSSFGTFPLESMKSNVPVIGVVPDLPPDWMNEDNGIWINDPTIMIDVIADFIQNWLEDNIKPELYENMKITSEKFSDKQKFQNAVINQFEEYKNYRLTAFESQINKTEE